jgi:hypothetical protein
VFVSMIWSSKARAQRGVDHCVCGERVGTYKSQSASDDHEEFPGEDGPVGIEQAIGWQEIQKRG